MKQNAQSPTVQRLVVALLVGVLGGAGCAVDGSAGSVEASSQHLRTGVSTGGQVLVGVDVLVTEADGTAVPCGEGELDVGLEVSFDDGASFEPVPSRDFAVSCAGGGADLAMVLDNSASLDDTLPWLRRAAAGAAAETLRAGGHASVVRVSTNSTVLTKLTDDPAEVEDAITSLRSSSGWTALYDGVRLGNETLGGAVSSANDAHRYASAGEFCTASRKAGILVFTDGQENNSSRQMLWNEQYPGDGYDTTFDDVMSLRVDGITTPVYVVTMSDKVRHTDMKELAEATGGRYRRIRKASELADAFSVVGEYASSSHQICGSIGGGRCGLATVRVRHSWTDGDQVVEGTREELVNIPCGVKEPSRVVSILLSMSNPGIPRSVASKLSAQALEWASPVENPRVLVVRDDNHHNEFANDPKYVTEVLGDLGYDVTYAEEPSNGLTGDMLDGFDAVWFSNPGYPMDDQGSLAVLLAFSSEGGGVVMQGDDMAWSWGGNFSMEPLTKLRYRDNGTDYCGVWIDNNASQNYTVTVEGDGHPVVAGLEGTVFEYGDDIDTTAPLGQGEEVLAWANVAKSPGCGPKPVVVAFTP